MHYPQLVVYETSSRLATWLREAVGIAELLRYDEEGRTAGWLTETPRPAHGAEDGNYGWLLREPRQPAACLRLLQRGAPSIVVIQLTKEPQSELALLDQIAWRYPETLTVVVGQEEHRTLAPLAWDLGATAVLLPPRVGERLQEVVLGLMQSVTTYGIPAAGPNLTEER
jgi:hypothetical protein